MGVYGVLLALWSVKVKGFMELEKGLRFDLKFGACKL